MKSNFNLVKVNTEQSKNRILAELVLDSAKSTEDAILYFSNGKSSASFCSDMISCVADSKKIKNINGTHVVRLSEAVRDLSQFPIYVDDTDIEKTDYILLQSVLLRRESEISLILVDNLSPSSGIETQRLESFSNTFGARIFVFEPNKA